MLNDLLQTLSNWEYWPLWRSLSRSCVILAFIKIFVKKLRAEFGRPRKRSLVKFLTVTTPKSHKSDKDRLVIPEGDDIRSLEHLWFIRWDSSLLHGRMCLFYISLLTSKTMGGGLGARVNFQPLNFFFLLSWCHAGCLIIKRVVKSHQLTLWSWISYLY